MKSFLQHIIDDIDDCGSLKEEAYIFPNRRSCLYFKISQPFVIMLLHSTVQNLVKMLHITDN